ncbi:YfjI family protein [Lysinibacillus sp. FSL K6-3209]|uniref:YfjI family protein n=1 Tax=Lysinibacillus sp. FSL K6-3209 TaxID=2921497 RepID=UPI0030DBE3B6
MQNNQECNEFEQKENQEVEDDFSELKLAEAKLELDIKSEKKHAKEKPSNVQSDGQQSSIKLYEELYEELYESINSLDEYGFEWQPPITFEESALKQFDVNIFPNTLKNMVLAVSRFTQTPVDLAAICLIGVLSTVLQKKFHVEPIKGWKEPLNTYTAVLLQASNRKSAVFGLMIGPLFDYESNLIKSHQEVQKKNEKHLSLLNRRIDKLENEYAKSGDTEPLDDLENLWTLREKLKPKPAPTLILDNSTEEVIVSRISQNSERIAIASSEGDLFERLKSSIKFEASKLDVYLKGYSGDYLRTDRISRDTERIEEPLVTICISAQPTVIQDMPQKIIDRGLIPRFLISMPEDLLGKRDVYNAKPVDSETKYLYNNLISKLLNFEDKDSIALELSSESYDVLKKFEHHVETLFLPEQLYCDSLKSWGGKIIGNLLRITGLLHVAKHTDIAKDKSDIPTTIEVKTLKAALKLKEYFDSQIINAYGIMFSKESNDMAQYLLGKLELLTEEKKQRKVSKQDLWQKTKKIFTTAPTFNLSLKILEERGFIQFDFGGKSGRKEFIILSPFVNKDKKT